MPEFFAVINTNAAPFFSDTITRHFTAEDGLGALNQALQTENPFGLYSIRIYTSADNYHKDRNSHLHEWLSERAAKAWRKR
jgi:hypothetical protein